MLYSSKIQSAAVVLYFYGKYYLVRYDYSLGAC